MVQTVNEQLLDKGISHAIDATRYGNGVVLKMIEVLNKSDKHLAAALFDVLQRLPKESYTVQRLEALLGNVRALNEEAYRAVQRGLETELRDLVDHEAAYQQKLFSNILPVQVSVASVTGGAVYTAAIFDPFRTSANGAAPLGEYLQGLSSARAGQVRDAIRLGYVTGETMEQIVTRIVGTKRQNYADGLLEIPRRHVATMVRTALNHTASFTRHAFYKANADLMKGYRWVSTLDTRTSRTCQALDGKLFKEGDGPIPPAHPNCRSTTIPVVKSWRGLGFDIDEIDKGTRESMDGQVPDSLTYQTWLKKQTTARQDDILGVSRGKLFRAGETVDGFVDRKGRTLTLDQLRKRDSDLFKKAGI